MLGKYEKWMGTWQPLNEQEERKVWDRIDEFFKFSPSIDQFPGFFAPQPFIKYDLSGKYNYGSPEIKELERVAKQAFISCTKKREKIFVVDYQHQGYWVDPRKEFPIHPAYRMNYGDERDEWVVDIESDGDYHFFLDQNFSFGILGHPWEQSLTIFGAEFISELLEQKPALLDKILESKLWQ